jgi:hypothetical protein
MWTHHARRAASNSRPGRSVSVSSASTRIPAARRSRRPSPRDRLDTRAPGHRSDGHAACDGEHRVRRSWHFAEDCQVERTGGGLRVTAGLTQVHFEPLEDVDSRQLMRGGTAEQGGWVSRSFWAQDSPVRAPTGIRV